MAHTSARIDHALSRSWLLVNAARPDDIARAVACDADQIILDIEDAVDPAYKDAARRATANWLDQSGNHAWVRINDASTEYWADDIADFRSRPGLVGVVLAKVESPQHITDTASRLGRDLPIVALIESALGIEAAAAIARTSGTSRLAFGSGDYRRDTGAAATDLAMSYPRSRLTIASRLGSLPGPIDGPTTGRDLDALHSHTALARSLGMTGRLCLSPGQTSVVNNAIGPSVDDIRWAHEFLADFRTAGGTVRDGSDKPRLEQATRITRLADAYGICASPI
ncbi:CoA ester lyase [Aldersonia sp. NBC_00410]|uniref:HpcH/HpaI aldolase/citrate lyase family protein n=1 Tax=Aldersonia sp. NBC_00410 TaxID=2975954 RepID=UPI0022536E60|nr:CoA ester lyase [Aldersonia sp. NBC_00410]MCX5046411.1 CoA ester lyase [Aldersonia sp. NBC_00410]